MDFISQAYQGWKKHNYSLAFTQGQLTLQINYSTLQHKSGFYETHMPLNQNVSEMHMSVHTLSLPPPTLSVSWKNISYPAS